MSDQCGYRSNKQATHLSASFQLFIKTMQHQGPWEPQRIQQHAIKTWSENRPNLPWLTLKKVCPGFTEPNSRGFAFSETPDRWTPWRISIHWPFLGSVYTEASRRETARTSLRCCGAKPGSPLRKTGLCVAALATLCGAHWFSTGLTFPERQEENQTTILAVFSLTVKFYLGAPKRQFRDTKCQRFSVFLNST